jgi:quinol-cytochrome oxidoreductase complex cytochrome b subunit
MHCDNYIRADSLVTPRHIQPEWYFLPFYAILRAIPSKGGGVFFMFGSIIVFFFLPWIAPFKLCIGGYSKLWVSFFSTFLFNVLILGILGARVVEEPYVLLSQFCTFYYFFYLLIIMPIFSMFETLLFIKKKSNN